LPADLDELAQRIKEEHSNVGSALQQGFIRDVNVPSGGSAAFLGISGGTLNVSAGETAHDVTISSGGTSGRSCRVIRAPSNRGGPIQV
jgi:hypothetical protein